MKREVIHLECGCVANARDMEDNPCCAVHLCKTQVEAPNLEGRKMRCAYFNGCKNQHPSDPREAFFESRPDQEFDLYYCGCHGFA